MKKLFRSRKFLLNFLLALGFTGLLLSQIYPGKRAKERLSVNDYTATFQPIDTSGHSDFFLFDSSYYVISTRGTTPQDAQFQFKEAQRLRIVLGIAGWSEVENPEEDYLIYTVWWNEEQVFQGPVKQKQDEEFTLRVKPGDRLKLRTEIRGNLVKDVGSLTLERVYLMKEIWAYVLLLAIFFITLFSLPYLHLRDALFSMLPVYLITLLEVEYRSVIDLFNLILVGHIYVILLSAYLFSYQIKSTWLQVPVRIVIGGFWTMVNLVPLTFILYQFRFGSYPATEEFNAFFQSNNSEMMEFFETYASLGFILAIVSLAGVLIWGFFPVKNKAVKGRKVGRLLFLLLLIFAYFQNSYVQQNSIYQLILKEHHTYLKELELFKKEQSKYAQKGLSLNATKKEKGEIYVVVIGESQNKYHLSAYGYHRKTTPFLDSLKNTENAVLLERAFSNHTHTNYTIGMALTSSNQQNKRAIYESVPLIPLMKHTGFKTYWISNQIRFGAWDNMVSVMAEECDKKVFINKNVGEQVATSFFDEDLIPVLRKELNKPTEENRIYFVHLMGNHSDYAKRYPDEFKVWTGPLDTSEFGKIDAHGINKYDNSILYTDYVLSHIHKELDKAPGEVKALVYFSDHGEDVDNNIGHNASGFTCTMPEIGTYLWMSNAYQVQYPTKMEALQNNANKYWCNDLIYELLMGLSGIESDLYNPVYDITDARYFIPDSSLFTLHGAKPYADPENTYYQVVYNYRELQKDSSLPRIAPHRVNSKAMYYQVIRDGFKQIEIDLVFRQDSVDGYFEIGHGEVGAMSHNTLEDLLQWKNADELGKIWLDIKNINASNLAAIQQRLLKLDSLYIIKERVIIESSIRDKNFALLNQSGFHTSYYLPFSLLELKDAAQKRTKALGIANQIKMQGVSAVSFDSKLYPFVKQYLEPQINASIVYHTWDISLELDKPDFSSELRARDWWSDDRIKTILVRYNSRFYL